MGVELTNNELITFGQHGITPAQIRDTVNIYRSQGLSDDDIRKKVDAKLDGWYAEEYGAENMAKAQGAVQQVRDALPSNTWIDNVLKKEALQAGAEGALIGVERVLNGATVGAYDWANEKLGGNARGRTAEFLRQADEQGLGKLARAGVILSDIGGGMKSPIAGALGKVANYATNPITNNFVRSVAQNGMLGSMYGLGRGAFDSNFDESATAQGALIGGGVGMAVPFAANAVKYARDFAKNSIHAGRNAVDKVSRGALSPSAEDMAAGAQEISGALPDNGEITGTAVKKLADDITRSVKTKATALYDKAEQLASGRPVLLDKNSNFAKAFDKLSQNATKSGRAELNKVWEEVGHNNYDAPTYETAKSFRSWLSEKSATGGTGLTKKQYGDLLEALDKDIELSLGREAAAAKKTADAFYRNEMGNPDSITNSVNKLLRNDPVSVVGNRTVSSAQGKAWKASPLQKVLDEGEKIGSPYVADVKNAIQANTTTRAQFNRMSPQQKAMIYGDKLNAAEKNFNGGILNWTEKALTSTTDAVLTPFQRMLEALNPVAGLGGAAAWRNVRGSRAGVRELNKASSQQPVKDVKMSPISRERLNAINVARAAQGLPLIEGRGVSIPASQITHINAERIKKDGYTVPEAMRALNLALYGKNSQVSRQSSPITLQALINNDGHHENVAIVGKHRDTGDVFVKTGYHLPSEKINQKKMIDYARDGRPVPSSTSHNAPGSGLSALSGITRNSNIKPSEQDVKKIQAVMAIINALYGNN